MRHTTSVIGALERRQEYRLRLGERPEYVRGWVERLGRRFVIDRRAYIPNEQSEHLITYVLERIPADARKRLVEVGTGCGWIAITMKRERPGLDVVAVDVEPGPLELAAKNAEAHGTDISFHESLFMDDLPEIPSPSYVISDMPYGDSSSILHPEGTCFLNRMPPVAVFHPDGPLHAYKGLVASIKSRGWTPRTFIETGLVPEHIVRAELPIAEYARTEGYSVAELDMRGEAG